MHTQMHALRPLGSVQVYYLPILAVYNQVTLPTLLTALPLLRDIFIREQITIVHGHGVRKRMQGVFCLEGKYIYIFGYKL